MNCHSNWFTINLMEVMVVRGETLLIRLTTGILGYVSPSLWTKISFKRALSYIYRDSLIVYSVKRNQVYPL